MTVIGFTRTGLTKQGTSKTGNSYYFYPQWMCAAKRKNYQNSYERNVLDMMRSYSDTPWKDSNISEVEVFIGSIVGKEKQTKRQKESSAALKSQYENLVWSVTDSIRGECHDDTLAVGMACLYLCKKDRETQGPQNGLQSFAWVAAGLLLTEIDKMQKFAASGRRRRREFY